MATTTPYYDQNHPFWAFVADLHQQGPAHPFFARRGGAKRGDATNGGSDEERPNQWGRMRRGPMRGRGGHGPHQHRHARFAAQQDEEMRDLTSDTEVDVKIATPRTRAARAARAAQEPDFDALVSSGDEGRRGPGGRHAGRMGGGKGRGRGMGFRGGRGGMGARFAQAGPIEVPSDCENFQSGDEFQRGPGMRRGGRFAGRGRGMGGPKARARAAAAGTIEATEPMVSDAENQQVSDDVSRGPGARRAARLAGKGRGVGGPRARANREVIFDAAAPGPSDEENAVSGDEMQRVFRPRRGLALGGRGGRMGGGRGGPFGLGRHGRINHEEEVAGPRGQGHHGRQGPRGPHAHGPQARAIQAHGPHAHGPHAHGPHARGPLAMLRQGPFAARPHANRHADGKFRPEVDVFDHAEAYMVHVSIPGAKKQDIEVNWNVERSALIITGTINRPGDEEVLKTLSTKERNVGEFKRMVRLGKKGSPAQVDVEGIKAKIEDGVLRIEVPKMDSGFVEVKKVDVA